MQIKNLELFAKDIPAQRMFYSNILGLRREYVWEQLLTIYVGTSQVTFTKSQSDKEYKQIFPGLDYPANIYHIAFNIPENQIEAAKAWLENRKVPLISADGQDIFHFEDWDAHSIYFKDPTGNILEFIARHTLDNASDKPFGADSILCVSEFGIVVDDVPDAVNKIVSVLELSVYKNSSSDTFAAMGDENGLFILVKRGRMWYPQTGIPAGINFGNVTISQNYIFKDQAEIKEHLFRQNVNAELEETYIDSWNKIERFYGEFFSSPSWDFVKIMLPFMQLLRQVGYDKHLLAKSSHASLLLVRHENWSESASMYLAPLPNGKIYVTYLANTGIPIPGTHHSVNISRQLLLEKPELTDELEGLLLRLLMQPID